MARFLVAAFVCAACCALSNCRSATASVAPPTDSTDATCPVSGRCLVVTGLAGPPNEGLGRVMLVDVDRRTILGHTGPVLRLGTHSELLGDSRTLVLSGSWNSGGAIGAVDLSTGRVLWKQSVPPTHSDPTGYAIPQGFVVSPDQSWLVASNAGGGLLRVNLKTDSAEGFASQDGSPSDRIFMTRSGRGVPAGTIISGASRDEKPPFKVFLYSPLLTVQDSIVPPEGRSVLDILLSEDDTLLYVLAPPRLFAVNLVTRSIVYDVVTPSFGRITMSPDGEHVFLSEHASLDFPAPGILLEYSRDLSSVRGIPLVHPDSPDPYPSAWGTVATRDGRWVYVATGAYPLGTLGYGPGVIRIVDLAVGKVVGVIPLEEYATRYGLHLIEP